MRTKYDVGDVIYIPMKIEKIEMVGNNETGIYYTLNVLDEYDKAVKVREDYLAEYSKYEKD